MPISGLVIVLDGRAEEARTAIDTICANDRLTVGRAEAGDRVPVVLETESHEESREQLAWIEALPGVAMVEVAYVDLSDLGGTPTVRKERANDGS